MKNLPFDVINNYDGTSPIRFKHDEASRTRLKEKICMEELLDIIIGSPLEELLEMCLYNNDIDFAVLPVEDDNTLSSEDPETSSDKVIENIEIPQEVADMYNALPADIRRMYLVQRGETISVVLPEPDYICVKQETDIGPEVYECFLNFAEIDTLHKLGKIINRGIEIFREYKDDLI